MFIVAAAHGIASLLLLALGAAIALRPKTRRARHPQLGRIYAWTMPPVLVVGFVIGLQHWPSLSPFQIVVPPTIAAVCVGWFAASPSGRRRFGPRWLSVHIQAMGGSLIALSTGFGFQVAARAGAPIDEPLITVVLFAVPTIIGSPIIGRAIAARGLARVAQAQPGPGPLGAQQTTGA